MVYQRLERQKVTRYPAVDARIKTMLQFRVK
jgi:hypothetical protein